MSTNYYDKMLAASMIEEGAFMFLSNPLTMDMLQYLWQHVIREKHIKRNKILRKDSAENFNKLKGKRCFEECTGSGVLNNISGKGSAPMKKARARKSLEINEDSEPINTPNKVQKKGVTEWTEELRAKFWAAVNQLGEGRCYPKDILEIMNVPGLSRHNVSSYLQHCRNANISEAPSSPKSNPCREDGRRTRVNKRSYGSMPLPALGKSSNYVPPNCQQIQEINRSPKSNSPPGKNIVINEKGENVEQSSIPQPSQISEPLLDYYSVPNMPQVGSYETLFGANEISNANVHGENIAANGAASMINFPSYTHLLSDLGNATSYLGDNFLDFTDDGVARQFIGVQPNGNPSQRDFTNHQVYSRDDWTAGTSNSHGDGYYYSWSNIN